MATTSQLIHASPIKTIQHPIPSGRIQPRYETPAKPVMTVEFKQPTLDSRKRSASTNHQFNTPPKESMPPPPKESIHLKQVSDAKTFRSNSSHKQDNRSSGYIDLDERLSNAIRLSRELIM